MFDPTDQPRVLAVPPGADFPAVLAQGLRERMSSQSPEAMARVEVVVNSARMQSRLRAVFVAGGPGFLPRIRLITDLAEAPGQAPLRTRLELAQLIRGLLKADPDLAPPTAAFALAESLFKLLDEVQGEVVALSRLDALDVSQHSLHWDRSLRFIRLISRIVGPASGTQSRLRQAVAQRAVHWQVNPPQHPVILAGSTGSRGPTATLMTLVAALPQGALVLPGFDFDMPADLFDGLDDPLVHEDHPQFRFARLLRALGMSAGQVRPWTAAPPPDPARNALVSLALRPAPITDQWLQDGPYLPDLRGATAGLDLVEAQDARSEALAIALCMRQAIVDGRTVALVTPDRTLARRVTAALGRWHLRPDDSAGRPLDLSAPGRFLLQVVQLMTPPISSESLIALLKHPLACSAMNRGEHLRHTRDLELFLRAKAIPYPVAGRMSAWAEKDSGRKAWVDWIGTTLGPAVEGAAPLSDWIARHRSLAEAWTRGPWGEGSGALWLEEAGQAVLELVDSLQEQADAGGVLEARDYSAVFETLLAAGQVREVGSNRADLMIWGTLEVRALGADQLILGGLNEGIWPSIPAPDPWFNRKMRLDAGLTLPERQVGLAAHDFQQAVCARRVVLTRALRDSDATTVPCRWLNRLENLVAGLPMRAGAEALAGMRARGATWLDLARRMEADLSAVPPECARPNPRPAPAPPLHARLKELPVTRVETLVRDPYAIYAERILRLRLLDPLTPEADFRLRGTALHRIPEIYVKAHPPGTPGSLARFQEIAAAVLDEDCAWPATRAHWMARLERVAAAFVAWNEALNGELVLREKRGAMVLGDPPFTLTGQPDRIDRMPDGRLRIYDYKTGTLPGTKQIEHFNKQLVLLALMCTEDAFGLGPAEVAEAAFVGLGSTFKEKPVSTGAEDLARHRREFVTLVRQYRQPEQGFTALRAPDFERNSGDFDALSRRGEWEVTDPAVTIRVGDCDG